MEVDETTRWMRRDLRKLVALEWAQTMVGVGLLVVIAARAVVVAEDGSIALALTIADVLAMAFLFLAMRIRMGHEALRRDVQSTGTAILASDAVRRGAGDGLSWIDLGETPVRGREGTVQIWELGA